MFEVHFKTTAYAPPRSLAILTPLNDWENIEGTYVDGGWTFTIDENLIWTKPGYFKFLLDDQFWMDDPYIRIAPTAGSVYNFDESTVTFAMSTPTPPAPVQPAPAPTVDPVPTPVPAPVPAPLPIPPISEGAVINRVVILITPLLTVAAAWLAALVARHVPGAKLNQTQIVSFMIAIVAVCLAAAWKWLQGWQQHELLVAKGLAAPIKPVIGNVPTQR